MPSIIKGSDNFDTADNASQTELNNFTLSCAASRNAAWETLTIDTVYPFINLNENKGFSLDVNGYVIIPKTGKYLVSLNVYYTTTLGRLNAYNVTAGQTICFVHNPAIDNNTYSNHAVKVAALNAGDAIGLMPSFTDAYVYTNPGHTELSLVYLGDI